MKILALSLLLAAPVAAQVLTFPQLVDTAIPIRWRDVAFTYTSISPIAVGNEIGLLVLNDAGVTFTFFNWTPQQLRVHAIGWSGTGAARLEGRQVCTFTYRTAYPFTTNQMGGTGWTTTNFMIGQVDPLFICTPETRWHFQTWNGFGFGGTAPHAFIVTAVGGW